MGTTRAVRVRMRVHRHSVHRLGPPSHPQRSATADAYRNGVAAGCGIVWHRGVESSWLRGFYIDMNTEVPGPLLYTSEEVVDAILNIDQINEEYKERYEEFYKRFCCYDDGNASKHIVEEVFK